MSRLEPECVFCFQPILEGHKIRIANKDHGRLHPQWHIFPHGGTINNEAVKNACMNQHYDHPHIHEDCVPAWCDKFNMDIPEPFIAGDQERLDRELK